MIKPNPKLIAWSTAAMLSIAVPLTQMWEGKSNIPRWDSIGKRWEVCHGDTSAVRRTYTDAECEAMLRDKLKNKYGKAVAQCVPALQERPMQWAASTVLAYNIGEGGFCRSTAAKRFNAGDWWGGCEAFKLWVWSNGKLIEGLANRRYKGGPAMVSEFEACTAGLT